MTSTTSAPGSPQEAVEVRTENLFQRTEVLAGTYHNGSQRASNLLFPEEVTSKGSINMTPACVDIFSAQSGGAAASPPQMSPPVLPLDTARLAVCLHANRHFALVFIHKVDFGLMSHQFVHYICLNLPSIVSQMCHNMSALPGK